MEFCVLPSSLVVEKRINTSLPPGDTEALFTLFPTMISWMVILLLSSPLMV